MARSWETFEHAVEKGSRRAYLAGKTNPETAESQAVRLLEPLEKSARERGFPDAAETVDEDGRGRGQHRAFEREHRGIAADEAVGVLRVAGLVGQEVGSAVVRTGRGPREREPENFLLVQDRYDPVFQGELAAGADPVLLGQHLLAAFADGLCRVAALKQGPVERGDELFGRADAHRVGHRRDAAHARLDQSARDGREGRAAAFGDCRAFARVEQDERQAVFAQERGELRGRYGIMTTVRVFEQ